MALDQESVATNQIQERIPVCYPTRRKCDQGLQGHVLAVLLDWDGVLLDSLEANLNVYNKILVSMGITPLNRAEFLSIQSPNWYIFYEKLGFPTETWPRIDALWMELYEKERVELHSDVKTSLVALRAKRIKLGLVSNGVKKRVLRELGRFDVLRFMDALVLGGDVDEMKPSPKPLLLGLQRLQVRREQALYVGDCPEDVEAARAAGVGSVALARGLAAVNRLEAAGPDYLFFSLEEMVRALL